MRSDRSESAEFALAADQEASKLVTGVEKVLANTAGRGFAMPSGDALASILALTQEAKGKVGEGNAKIYERRRGVLFQIDEFEMKFVVSVAKLAMELYREQIMEALALEMAQWDSTRDMQKADIARLNIQTEQRQVAIIRDRAEQEARIIVFKRQLVAAQEVTLGQEAVLVQAQIATATKKLEIIDSIYQVLAAEQLVLAAERRKAAAMQQVLVAEQAVAVIKQGMVPFYLQKADAEQQLAAATTAEIPILRAIEMLGYDRIALRNAQEDEAHQERLADLNLTMAQEAFTRASNSLEVAKTQSRRLLVEYRNQIQSLILNQKKALQEEEVAFRLATGLQREAIGVNNEVAITKHETSNILTELVSLLSNLEARALDQNTTVRASAIRQSTAFQTRTSNRISNAIDDLQRQIIVGSF